MKWLNQKHLPCYSNQEAVTLLEVNATRNATFSSVALLFIDFEQIFARCEFAYSNTAGCRQNNKTPTFVFWKLLCL